MSRNRALVAAVAVVSFAGVGASDCLAADPWDEPFGASAATLLEAARAVPDRGADSAVVLLEEGTYSFDDAGRITRTYRLVYRLTSQEGVEDWGRVEAGFAAFHQARPQVRARVITPSGEEHWLDPGTIDDTPVSDDPDIYGDHRMLRAPLPHLSVGAVVEHETSTRDDAPLFDAASMGVFYFGQSQPARSIRLVLDAPLSRPLRVSLRGLDGLVPVRTERDGRARLVFEMRDVAPWEPSGALLPPEALRWPHVAFTTGRSWNEVARRYSELVERMVDAEAVAAIAREAAAGETDRRRIVAACVAALRKRLRYVGIEFGVAAIIPVTPTRALQRGYGDCKDQATFLVSMLRSLGIDARLALLGPGPGPDVDEDVPGVGAFGHAIAHVPGDPPLWVDTTDPFTPVGELPAPDQGRLALIASPDTVGLTRTPLATSAENRTLERIEIRLAEVGPARIREVSESWGVLASEFRANYQGATAEEIEATLTSYTREMYLADAIENVEHSDGARLEPSYRVSFVAPQASRGMTDLRQAAAAFVSQPTYSRLTALMDLSADADGEGAPGDPVAPPAPETRPRGADWILPEAFSWERRYDVVPPPGFQLRSSPESVTTTLGKATFTREVAVAENGSVSVVHRFDTVSQRFTDAEWQALRKGLAALSQAPPDLVVFDNVGELHLAEGRIREALGQFRVLAALHPSEALHRVQIARALLAAGLGDAALAEAQRAVDVEPASALAHRVLGYVHEHDALGRRFGPGSDVDATIRHLRRALELDPDDAIARAELAFVLERDAEGELLWSGPALAEAIAEYRKLKAMTPDADGDARDAALLAALVRARDWPAARALAEESPKSESRDATILLCIAASEGASVALARSLKPPFDASRRSEMLRLCAARLAQARLYPEAALFFDEAAKGTSRVADLHESAALFRRVRPYEQSLLPESDPRSVVQRMEVAAARDDVDAQLALVASALADSDEERSAMVRDFESARRARGSRAGIAPEFRLDLVLSTEQLATEGDELNGWRVRVRRSGEAGDRQDDVYVVREGGAWRIAGTAGQPQHLGRQALDRLDAGDLAGARRWLDWARDHLRAGDADDPAWMDVFPRAWRKGQEATAEHARLAAAILVARTADRDRALPILRAAREAPATPEQALDLDMALLTLFLGKPTLAGADQDEALRLARAIASAQPTSPTAFRVLANTLMRAHRLDELEVEARRRLERTPDDPTLQRAVADLLGLKGNLAAAEAAYRSLLDRGHGAAGDANMLAWMALFSGRSLEKALEDAQRAVQMSHGRNPAFLHTLAAVLAESGRATAAREIVLRTLDEGDRQEPQPSDWYVLGRIAEEYGEREAALAAYGKVRLLEGEEDSPHLSCLRLAQRRITGLTTPAGKPAEAR